MLYGAYIPTLVALLVFIYVSWVEGDGEGGDSSTPHDTEEGGRVVSDSRWLRLAMFLVSVVLVSVCAVITLVSEGGESPVCRL